ncbi:hypothetical protein DRF67_00725 [Chryseobacterium pennipullorum]|uniref:SHOCT domain-containing protein n=2 Tax=Chryseobacterium pennipullorum TaxID=2258963 RepID=A0A3D9B9H9_9FLAO|nr:hypothetical protein DRF67_00725 [Chryseobacterium pennipullorum]
MDKEDAEKFYDVIRMIYNDPQKQNQNQSGRGKEVSSEMVFEQLEKLGRLRESGILTDAEFTEQKRKLLEQLR